MAWACHTEVTVGGGGIPPPVLPRCYGRADTRSAPSWRSALSPGHYTHQMGRASAPTFSETPSCTSWDRRPHLPLLPPDLEPPLPRHARIISAQPVTPLKSPSCTQGCWPNSSVSPCSSFMPLSSSGYSLIMSPPRPPDIYGIPSPLFCRHLSSTPPSQILLSACQTRYGSTSGWRRLPSRSLGRKMLPALSTANKIPLSAVVRRLPLLRALIVRVTVWSMSLSEPCHRCCCRPCRQPHPLPPSGITSGRPLLPPQHWIWWATVVSLRHTSISSEGFSPIPYHPSHHIKPLPVPV